MTTITLKEQIVIKGTIEVLTGLHIGGNKEEIEIGGMDNPVIKNPITKEPYIPGSSIKGKMRSLLELKYNKTPNGEPCACGNCQICNIFGCSKSANLQVPTALIVRDATLNEKKTKENLQLIENDFSVFNLIEEKTENTINRLIGTAKSPRKQERVVPGTIFDFEMVFRVFADDKEELLKYIKEGLDLLQADYLGGNGSRGCGKIKIELDDQSKNLFNNNK